MNKTSWQALVAAIALCAPLSIFAASEAPAGISSQVFALSDFADGSSIPHDVVRSALPFNKRYAELTAAQKAVLRQDYTSLGANDDTPFPALGLAHLVKPMMKLAQMQGTHGAFIADVVVGPDGQARTVTVHQSPDANMTQLAGGAMALEKYTPAVCNGKPCVMSYVLRLDFDARQQRMAALVPVENTNITAPHSGN